MTTSISNLNLTSSTNALLLNSIPINDGSGNLPYITSASFLLFAIQSLVLGLFLCLAGKRMFRLTTALSVFLIFEFLTWIVIINTLRDEGFNSSYSGSTNGVIIWAVVTIFGLLFSGIGAVFWRIGIVLSGGLAGAALGFSIVLMANDDISVVPRWIIIGVLIIVGFVLAPLLKNGMAIATALIGSWLLCFGIDLFINEVNGMSLGMRFLLDHKDSHQSSIMNYYPPISTRVLLALIWIFATISTIFQSYWYSAPFNRNFKNDTENLDLDSGSLKINSGTGIGGTEMSTTTHDTIASKIQRRYDLAVQERNLGHNSSPSGSMNKPIMINHPEEMSDPNEPNSRPGSILETTLADGLRSRPPTLFNEPFNHQSTTLPEFHNFPSTTTDFKSFAIPISAVGGGVIGASAVIVEEEEEEAGGGSHVKRHSEDDDIYGLSNSNRYLNTLAEGEGTIIQGGGGGGESSREIGLLSTKRDSDGSVQSSIAESRKSWRKPVPSSLDDNQISNQQYQNQNQPNQDFVNGLNSGRNFRLEPSIAPSNYSDTTTGIMAQFSPHPPPHTHTQTYTEFGNGINSNRRLSQDNNSERLSINHSESINGNTNTNQLEEGERSPNAESFRTAASTTHFVSKIDLNE